MRRSSTSSSDGGPLPRQAGEAPNPRSREWRIVALIVVAVLASAELALRRPEVRRILPPRTHYYHPIIAQRLDAIERLRHVYDRIDVLFVGSSIVLTNVHALLFDLLVGQQPGAVVSFNAGLPGLWPTSVHLYTEHVWLPAAQPRLVIQGVRYPELRVRTHAKNETQVWTGRVEAAWRNSDLLTRLQAEAVSRVHLLQYRGALTRYLQRFRSGLYGTLDPEEDDTYAVRGYMPMGAPESGRPEDAEPDLPNDGTCDNGACEVGFAALRRTIAATRAAGGEYVLLNVPEHASRWRSQDGVARYRRYLEALQTFATAEGVRLIDPTDGNPFRYQESPYNDLSHMTAAGARQFTGALAGRLQPVVAEALRAQPKPPRPPARAAMAAF